jgi:hypothetical protein
VDVDKSSQDQSTLPHSKEKTTHPAIVYFKAFPTGSSVTGSAKLCPYLRTDQIEQYLLPVIRIDIDILGTRITVDHVFQSCFLDSCPKESLEEGSIQLPEAALIRPTARSRVIAPRLTSRKEPFNLPASSRLTSIRVDTRRVLSSSQYLLRKLCACTHNRRL